jgi:5'-deoxynucleotidase YfbR-like HD superfamily hydrolase
MILGADTTLIPSRQCAISMEEMAAPRGAKMKQPRAWQRMLSGRRLDLLDPTPMDIEIEDIAHGLAFVARWNGQTHGQFAYSVAEHSVLVEHLFSAMNPNADAKWKLAALLHDAPEYVIGDMISPVKAAVGPGYAELDDRLTAAIHLRFGLPAAIPLATKKQIKKADKLSAWLEATQIAGFEVAEANKFFGKPTSKAPLPETLEPRPPMQVKADFIARFNALSSAI